MLAKPKGHLYAAFMDCVEGVDRVTRHLLVDFLLQAGMGGPLLNALSSFSDKHSLSADLWAIEQGLSQNIGTPQENPLSCSWFIPLLSDLVCYIGPPKPGRNPSHRKRRGGRLFHVKILPMLGYSLGKVGVHLTWKHPE